MTFICNFCKNHFIQKKNLHDHLNKNRCKSELLTNFVKLNQLLTNLHFHQNLYNLPTINDLNLDFITPEYFKQLILTEFNDTFYDNNSNKNSNNESNKSLSQNNNLNYTIKIKHILKITLKDIVCNKKYPQNQIIKYTQISDSTKLLFTIDNSHIYKEDTSNISNASEIIISHLVKKLGILFSKFIQYYENDDKDFDYGLYQDFILLLQKYINQTYLTKILQNIINKNILNNKKYKI